MPNIVRTKMADALIGAVHTAIDGGNSTGHLGRVVLTNEAKGTGVIMRRRVVRDVKGTRVHSNDRQVV